MVIDYKANDIPARFITTDGYKSRLRMRSSVNVFLKALAILTHSYVCVKGFSKNFLIIF